jgi:hypothetical protein
MGYELVFVLVIPNQDDSFTNEQYVTYVNDFGIAVRKRRRAGAINMVSGQAIKEFKKMFSTKE